MRAAADANDEANDGALQGLPGWARKQVEAALRDPAACTTLYLNGHGKGNKLAALPAAFGQLTALTTLSLGENLLAALPDAFGQLTALTELNLRSNQLADPPMVLARLPNLTTLDLSNNPFLHAPEWAGHTYMNFVEYVNADERTRDSGGSGRRGRRGGRRGSHRTTGGS